MSTNYVLLIAFLFTAFACSPPEPKDELTLMEESFYQQPDKDKGLALVAAYEAKLDTMKGATADEKINLLSKTATVYFRLGSHEGLQSNFARLLQEFNNEPKATKATQNVLDTLLYSITDPTTQRLVPNVAKQYIALTEIYAKAKPDAPESPEQLYKAGEIARSIGAYQQALSIYATIEGFFPQYEKAPKALFMQGFTYAEDLGDEEKAREFYEAFIAKYPNDDFVDDAQILLETLGKSDEEIFQQLENKK
ncbi:tol-pal system YbgF family protein [Lewinella sp. LCG006]|uniref:tetratricopeptide repeat protein n=1 Tax=Lewinella sp. LCG006 TaxID=3231911 RepID=UPI00345FF0AC